MPTASNPPDPARPAIVLAAFGTASEQGRQVYGVIEQAARRRYPGHEIVLAFTSGTVIARLRRQNVAICDPREALARLQAQGHRRAALQPLVIGAGRTHAALVEHPPGPLQVRCGMPLLTGPGDVEALLEAVAGEVPSDRPTVFVIHGSASAPAADETWRAFASAVEKRFDNAVACSLRGAPGTDGLARVRQRAQDCGAVHFMPLLLTAGAHIEQEVLGDAPDAWKNGIGVTAVSCARPLGYNPAIREMFFRRLDTALDALKNSPTLRQADAEPGH